MEENTLVLLLIVSGVVILAATTVYGNLVYNQIRGFLPLLASEMVCEKSDGGEYWLAAPTSIEACGKIGGMKFEESDCRYFPQEKRAACSQLAQLVSERSEDCVSTAFFNQSSKFGQGAPQADAACVAISLPPYSS